MTQSGSHQNPLLPNLMSPEMAGIGKKTFETFAAIQKEFLDALSTANRAWIAYLSEEAALNSDFTKKVTTTRSIPEAASAYQEWVSQQMELLSTQAQKVLAEAQDFTKACTQIMGNGKGPGSS